MEENFKDIDNRYKFINLLDQIYERSREEFNNWCSRYSGLNDAASNNYNKKISYEFASFLAELKNEIKYHGLYILNPKDYENQQSLKKIKNDIVDIVYPQDHRCRNREEYEERNRNCRKLADSLEDFFILAYTLGKESQKLEYKSGETNEVFDETMKLCHDKLLKSYNEGSRALAFLLSAYVNHPELRDKINL